MNGWNIRNTDEIVSAQFANKLQVAKSRSVYNEIQEMLHENKSVREH